MVWDSVNHTHYQTLMHGVGQCESHTLSDVVDVREQQDEEPWQIKITYPQCPRPDSK